MKTIKLSTIAAAFASVVLYNVPGAIAQDASPSPSASAAPSASPSPGGNPQDFRQRMDDRLKAELKTTSEEWTVIQPLLQKVVEKQRAIFAGRFGGRRGGSGAGGASGGQSGMPEADALRTAVDSDQTSNDDIKAKLAALRDARKKAVTELDQAREDLKKVLTLRQEAVLVSRGILD